MFAYKGKTALITGASSGIGAVFARELAARGMSVILVARSADRLQQLAGGLARRDRVRAEAIAADLSEPTSIARLIETIAQRGLTVDLLVNNAGFGLHGPFETLAAAREQQEVQVNIGALVALTHAVVPGMVARGTGGVINIASTLAFQPTPYMAVYGATKAFVLSFTHALVAEHRGTGVRFLALCPGPTATPFYEVSGGKDVFGRMRMRTPEQVVSTGLRGFERGRSVVVDGVANRWLFRFTGGVPDGLGARMLARAMRP